MARPIDNDEAAAAARRAAAAREAERKRAEAAARAAAEKAAAAAAAKKKAKIKNDEFSTGQTKSLRVRELSSGAAPMSFAQGVTAPVTAPATPTGTPAELKKKLADTEAMLASGGLPPSAVPVITAQVETLKDEYVVALEADIEKLKAARAETPSGLRHELDDAMAADRAEIARVRPEPPEAGAQRVADAYASGGPLEASEVLRSEVGRLGDDTARIDALLAASKPTIDQISNDLGTRIKDNQDDSDENPITRDVLGNFAAITDAAGDSGTQLIGESLAAAVSANAKVSNLGRGGQILELNQLDDHLNDLIDSGHGGKLANALGTALAGNEKPQLATYGKKLQDQAVDAVNKSRENAQNAHNELSKHEGRLAEDLQMYGPAMTPEERQKYIDAFWAVPEHADAKSKAASADSDFARQIEAMAPVLEARARGGDEEAAKALLDGAETLALSDTHAGQAVELVKRIGDDPALFEAIDGATDDSLETRLQDNVLAQALPRMQAQAIASGDEAGFEDTVKGLTKLKAAPNLAREVGKLSDTLAQLRADPNKFRLDQLSTTGKFGIALKSIAVVAGIATLANGDADELKGLSATLSTVKAGYELGSSLLSTFAKTAQLTGDVAKFGAKFLPYVGLAIDSVQFGQDIKKLIDGGNVGDGIATLGTGIALLGDLAGCIPVLGTLPDAALGALGAVVQGIGGLISNIISGNEEAEKLEQERDELLNASGVSADVKELLTTFDESTLKRMGMLGLDRAQVIGLLREESAAFENGSSETVQAFLTAMDVGAGFGLEGDELLAFMKDFTEAAAENPGGMYEVQNVVGWLDFHSDGLSIDSDGNPSNEAKKSLESDQTTVRVVLERMLPPELISKYGIDTATTDDINVGYYAAA